MVAQVMEVVVEEVAEVVVKPKPSHLSTLLYHGIRRAELGKTESVGGVGDGASADQGRKTRFMPHLSQYAYEDLWSTASPVGRWFDI